MPLYVEDLEAKEESMGTLCAHKQNIIDNIDIDRSEVALKFANKKRFLERELEKLNCAEEEDIEQRCKDQTIILRYIKEDLSAVEQKKHELSKIIVSRQKDIKEHEQEGK